VRKPVERYTPRRWQFGLHNRDPKASSSESEVLKISIAKSCKLNPEKWDKFCADFVDNPADVMLKSYGIYSTVTELRAKEVQYLLTLDALTLVLVLSSLARWPESEHKKILKLPKLFIGALVAGGFNIETLLKDRVEYCTFWDDLLLCENQIPMALMKKAFSICYGLLPEERRTNDFPDLRELENPDSCVTKELLDMVLKFGTVTACHRIFAEPIGVKYHRRFMDDYFEVGKLENCAHIFTCVHKVMTSYVEAAVTVGTPPIAVARTGGMFSLESLKSATDLKKAGLKIKGIPGMVEQVAFKNGCFSLPIMAQTSFSSRWVKPPLGMYVVFGQIFHMV